ncbi:MAG: peptide/nickel transport system substrate-binding protein [Actinomycetota bacterium]|nr:peptide/nickel transport system substrate-binding protein [Actinomycetota bacterium]
MRSALGSRKRSVGGAVAIALVMAMLIASCGGSSAKPGKGPATTVGPSIPVNEGKPTPGGSATMALPAESTGGWCLPEAQLAVSGIQVARAIYDYLAVPNDKNEYVPDLADKITPNADFTSWSIHVRAGIKFQDGTPLNGQAVKDNLDAYWGKLPSRHPLLFIFVFDNIKAISLVDPMTVKVDMIKPWSSFPASLYAYGRLGIMAEKQLNDGANCFQDMIGTGPFAFKGDWQRNDHLTVVKNPNYWRKDKYGQRLPYLDKLTFKPVTETSTLVNGLTTKLFDLTLTDDTVAISQLQPTVDSGGLAMLKSGQFPEVAYTLFNDSKPPFDNINARFAFAYAVNREEYNRIANKGLLQVASGPFGPGTLGYVANTNLPEYNVAKAKDYVQKYTQSTGQQLAFTFNTGSDPISLTNAQLVGKYAEAAGMKMNIKQVDEATLINDAINGQFQASAWRNHPGFDPDTQWVWWHCAVTPGRAASSQSKEIGTGDAAHITGNNCDNPVNFSRFNDAIINKAFETARVSDDPTVRKTSYETINKEFAKQLWDGWAYWSLWTMPSQTDVKGIIGPNLPTATSPDASDTGQTPFTGLSSGVDLSGLWLKK